MTVETQDKKLTGTSIEFCTLDKKSSVNEWNGIPATSISEDSGRFVTVTYDIPSDKTASAVLFALIGGADLGIIYSHRSSEDGEVYLTIKHVIDGVNSWEIKSDLNSSKASLAIVYDVESSILIGDQEVTTLD